MRGQVTRALEDCRKSIDLLDRCTECGARWDDDNFDGVTSIPTLEHLPDCLYDYLRRHLKGFAP
jgi:hypothetical protein